MTQDILALVIGVLLVVIIALVAAQAQQVQPSPQARAAVCAYNSSPPAVSSGQFVYAQCDSSGRLLLH